MELVSISFKKIMQSPAYTVIILGTEKKQFAIYTDPIVGRNFQILLTKESHKRPYTHDLIDSLLKGLEITLKQVVINDVEDTIYFARLFLQQEIGDKTQILEIDARPSDCLILAVLYKAPIFCCKEVLENAVPIEV